MVSIFPPNPINHANPGSILTPDPRLNPARITRSDGDSVGQASSSKMERGMAASKKLQKVRVSFFPHNHFNHANPGS